MLQLIDGPSAATGWAMKGRGFSGPIAQRPYDLILHTLGKIITFTFAVVPPSREGEPLQR